MKLYIKQQVFTLTSRFNVYDEYQNEAYYVEGEFLAIGTRLHIYNVDTEEEVALIRQRVFSFLPDFFIDMNHHQVEVIKRLTLFHPEYEVLPLGYNISGDFLAHEYTISAPNRILATISKKWFAWGDTYEIDMADDCDETLMLALVLVVDAVISAQRASSGSTSHH